MLPDIQRNTLEQGDPTLPPVSSPWFSAPASSSPHRNWNLRILGTAMTFGGGIVAGYVFPTLEIRSAIVGWLALLGLIVWGALAAALFQSLWAILIVPAVFSVSVFLGTIIQGGGFDFQAWLATAPEAIALVAIFGVLPLLLGVAIGAPLGLRLAQQQRR